VLEIKRQERITCSVGIGPNKIIAKIAPKVKKPDYSATLEDSGYKFFQLQRAPDNGTINCWIHSSIINDQHVKNQTMGHYGTFTQIAAYQKEKGFQNVQVHHEGDAEVTSELNGLTYAFEYERAEPIPSANNRQKQLHEAVI
jgi:hypothetical protein